MGAAFEAMRHAFALAEQWAVRCVMRVRGDGVRRRHDRQHADRHHAASNTPFENGARPGAAKTTATQDAGGRPRRDVKHDFW